MITIRGKEFSEETIVEALQKHCNFEEEKKSYIFKAGDVVEYYEDDYRIIVYYDGKLRAFSLCGGFMCSEQKDFEVCGYKKIGTLTDFIKENQNESAN